MEEFTAKVQFTQDPEFIKLQRDLQLRQEQERKELEKQQTEQRIDFGRQPGVTRQQLDDNYKRQLQDREAQSKEHKAETDRYTRDYHDAKVLREEMREQKNREALQRNDEIQKGRSREAAVTPDATRTALDETAVDKDPVTKLAWAHYAERIGLEIRQARDVESLGPSEHLTERHLDQTMDQDEKFGDEKEQTIHDLANEWVSTAESPEPHLRPVLTELAERQFKEATALFENSGLGSDFGLDGKRWEEHQRQVSTMNLHFHEERERCVRTTPEERVTLLVDLYMPTAHPEVMKDPITHLAWTEYADRLALRFRHELTFQTLDAAEQIQNHIDHRNAFMLQKENVTRDLVKQWAGEDPVEPEFEKLLTNLAERQFTEVNALFETSRPGSDEAYPGETEEHLAELSVLNGRFREERERYVSDYQRANVMRAEQEQSRRETLDRGLDPDKPKLTR